MTGVIASRKHLVFGEGNGQNGDQAGKLKLNLGQVCSQLMRQLAVPGLRYQLNLGVLKPSQVKPEARVQQVTAHVGL